MNLSGFCKMATCCWGNLFVQENKLKRDASGINAHEINYRAILVMRETRNGHTNCLVNIRWTDELAFTDAN